jgi:ABC-type transport system substrate-binding protein
MAQTLTTYFYTGKLEGLLATKWTPNADLTAWTFTLRSGVKFHDGTPFTADAVKKSIDRLLDPKLTVVTSNDVKYVKSVTVVDPQTVTFNLVQPVHFFRSSEQRDISHHIAAVLDRDGQHVRAGRERRGHRTVQARRVHQGRPT